MLEPVSLLSRSKAAYRPKRTKQIHACKPEYQVSGAHMAYACALIRPGICHTLTVNGTAGFHCCTET